MRPYTPAMPTTRRDSGPIVGITTDVEEVGGRERARCMLAYADAVVRAGGVPILLAPDPSTVRAQTALCDAVVLTGGDDPRTEPFGTPTHPMANPIAARRQAFESALIEILRGDGRPTLGVCLGMQMMALHAGGGLDQHMPDTRPDASRHWDSEHPIVPADRARGAIRGVADLPGGVVHSRHRQAVDDPGDLAVLACSDDGVIEAVADPGLPFYLGVQWHPERTADEGLGVALFRALVAAADARSR